MDIKLPEGWIQSNAYCQEGVNEHKSRTSLGFCFLHYVRELSSENL